MAIRFSDDYNRKIYNVVRNFNRKIKRLEAQGVKKLPEPISTRELKTNYQSRQQLNKQLKLYSEFGKRDATSVVETSGGAKAIKWEMDYLSSNISDTVNFLKREIEKSQKSDSEYRVLRKDYQNNLQYKIDLIERGFNLSSPRTYASQKEVVTGYLKRVERMKRGKDNWLDIANKAAKKAELKPELIKRINDKMATLDEQEFTDLFHEHGVIKRVYEFRYEEDDSTDPKDVEDILEEIVKL